MAKRVLLGALALLITAAVTARAQSDADTIYTCPFELDGLVFIKGSINGHDGLNFFLDTGASQTVLAEAIAGELGIEGGFSLPVGGVGQQSAKLGRAKTVAFAGFEVQNELLALMDISHIRSQKGTQIHAIIGAPVLFRFKAVTFDFAAKTVTFVADQRTNRRDFNVLDLLFGGGDQNPFGRLFGGGGGEGGGGESAPGEAPQNPLERLFGGGGGGEQGPRAFGGRRGRGVNFRGATFEPAAEQMKQHFGLDGGLYVKEVAEGSAAARAGLKAGDVLLSINDAAIASEEEIAAALRAARGPVTLTVLRKGERLTFATGQ